jgi:3-methyl-2-oxobutanoate hydroxymethyltransferase
MAPEAKITTATLRARKATGDKVAMVTAYDVVFAKLADDAGIDVVLVGDSVGMVMQGERSTVSVTLDEMVYHTRIASRGVRRAHLVGDMPFMSYQASVEDGMRAAGRLMKEGHAEAVKLEGGVEVAELIRRLVRAGIPVMGHVGLTPQSIHQFGGFKLQGRTEEQRAKILADARAVAEAGAYAIVVESVPRALAAEITKAVQPLTIGIGAGPDCDGQVLVLHDVLGLTDLRLKFAKQFVDLRAASIEATRTYVGEVKDGVWPDDEHSFH